MAAKPGKKPMTEQEKAKRKADLKSETPEARFVRVANVRVPKVLSALNAVGNLTGRSYAYTDEQREMIEKAIRGAADDAINVLRSGKRASVGFKL